MITQHYPSIKTEQIYYPDAVKKAINDTGSFLNKAFTVIGGYVKTGIEKTGGFIEGKVAQGEPTDFSEDTKGKWENLKSSTSNIITVGSEYVGKILNPVVTKAKEYGDDISNKINQSNNKTVKYVKELGVVSGKAVSEAVDGLVKGGTEVTAELGSQSKKIIDKKYGPNIVKTIVGEKKEEKEEGEPKEDPKGPEEPKGPSGG